VGDPNYKRPDNRMAADSVVKLIEVVECARALGVHVGPLRVQLAGAGDCITGTGSAEHIAVAPAAEESVFRSTVDCPATGTGADCVSDTEQGSACHSTEPAAVLVVPLHGWYHSSWDTEPDITDPQFLAVERSVPFSRKWGDYAMCTWPAGVIAHSDFVSNPAHNTVLAEVFAKLNEPFLRSPPDRNAPDFNPSTLGDADTYLGSPLAAAGDTVISFSHYLPRPELCPEKRFLTEPMLAKAVGSDVLESQVRRLQPHLHLYGHTHIPLGKVQLCYCVLVSRILFYWHRKCDGPVSCCVVLCKQ
jgi:hypothetical protein